MSNYEATKYDFDGANLTGIEGIPTATIVPWSSGSVPSGFLECNGAAVSRSTYAALFAIVGTTYGAGDGSTTFNVPDLQDNVAIGKSGTKALASTGGANTVASTGNVGGSTGAHTLTTGEIPSHSHPQGNHSGPGGNRVGTPAAPAGTQSTGGGGSHSHNMSATFSGDATSVLQPYLTIIYIIKT
jgi:microcystin-dependent protein